MAEPPRRLYFTVETQKCQILSNPGNEVLADLCAKLHGRGFVTVSHGMALSLLGHLGVEATSSSLGSILGRTTPTLHFASLGAETLLTELVLLPRCAAYVSIDSVGWISEITCRIAAMYFGERGEEIDRLLTALIELLVERGLVEAEAAFSIEMPQSDDTAWMESLPHMTIPPERSGKIRGAMALGDKGLRTELLDLIKARGQPRFGALQNEQKLTDSGLLQTRFDARCKDGSVFFSDVSAESIVGSTSVCPRCHRTGREHELVKSPDASPLAKELVTKSKWMTELSVLFLRLVGVPAASIRVPDDSRAPDEVDLAFMLDGSRYICELKDDDVNASDAGNLIARAAVIGSPSIIVMTTQEVRPDARRVLDRLTERPLPMLGTGATGSVTYVEGADWVTDFRWHMVFQQLERFSQKVRLSGPGQGISIYRLLSLHYFPPQAPAAGAAEEPKA